MREVEKRELSVPICLNSTKVQKAFIENINAKKFEASSDSYKCKSQTKNKVENKNRKLISSLRKLYEDKCAYCESSLLDTYAHIEHYRPKNKYYWLAYSWSNLLPVCAVCNTHKLENFEIFNNTPVSYNNQKLHLLHFKLEKYNKIEKQKLLHPEVDKFEHLIFYTNTGKMNTFDEKVKYTSKTCELNRDEIKTKRAKILNKFLNGLKDIYTKDGKDIKNFRYIIKTFIEDSANDCEFTVFKKFIIKRIDLFIMNDKVEFQEVVKKAMIRFA